MCIPIQKSMFLTPQAKRFPKGLIYKIPKSDSYRLADETGKIVGKMSLLERFCKNSSFYHTEPNGTTLHIYSLEIEEDEWGKGWGSYLLNFAKKESYRRGCKGRCSLIAHYPGRPPHIFYKKNGFVTPNKDINHLLDRCIELKLRPTTFNAIDMFVPIKEFEYPENELKPQKKNALRSFINHIMNVF